MHPTGALAERFVQFDAVIGLIRERLVLEKVTRQQVHALKCAAELMRQNTQQVTYGR